MKRVIAITVVLSAMFIGNHAANAAVTKVPAACSAGYVNISYDDSPTQYTPVILASLKANGLKATFFDVGDRMAQYPTYAKSQYSGGMQVENHTQAHADLTGAPSPIHDLVTTQYLLIQQTGQIPTFYRPPYGATNEEVRAKATELGLTEVIWTVDTVDWSGVSTAQILASVKTATAGDFVLMHDGYANTVNAIPQIAADFKARGLCAGKIVATGSTNAWEGLDFNASVAKF